MVGLYKNSTGHDQYYRLKKESKNITKWSRGKPSSLKNETGHPSFHPEHSNTKKAAFENFDCDFSIAFSNTKELYVSAATKISVFNAVGGNLLCVLKGHEHKIVALCTTQDSQNEWILSCDEQGLVKYWNTRQREDNQEKTVPILQELYVASDSSGCQNTSSSAALRLPGAVTYFSAFGSNRYIFTMVRANRPTKDLSELYLLDMQPGKEPKRCFVVDNVLRGQNKVSYSSDGKLIAALFIGRVFVAQINENLVIEEKKHHLLPQTSYPCILKFHPTRIALAVGYTSGMVQMWYNIFSKHPVKTFLHWHTMPVRALNFSFTGEKMFSGGEECVLVQWNLSVDNSKSFLPRMGTPIRGIVSDTRGEFVAVLHSDLGLSIVNAREMKLLGSIQALTLHLPGQSGTAGVAPLTAGLLYHPPTGAVVKNSKTGHLQFFRPQSSKVIFNLDITMSNFATEERKKKMPNPEVMLVSMSEDGAWLVTTETCSLTQDLTEIVIKFWLYHPEDKRWQLNTNVQMPHTDTVNCIAMKPLQRKGTMLDDDCSPLCVTGSQDGKIKFWKLITYLDPTGVTRSHWNSRAVREFRNLPATACDFANDGSLLGVAFGSVVTLWNPEEASLVGTLSQPYLKDEILDISFSRGDWQGSFLLARCESYVCSWDLLTCSLLWRACLTTSCWAVDYSSGLVAVFSKAREVFFFTPLSSQPVSSESSLSDVEIIRGIFVPAEDSNNSENSSALNRRRVTNQLYCFDANQSILKLNHPFASTTHSEENEALPSGEEDPMAPSEMYSALVARTRTRKHSRADPEKTKVSLIAPNVNALMKDLHDMRIHNLSFDSLKDHIGSFLPDLRDENEDSLKHKAPKYSTVEDGYLDRHQLMNESEDLEQKEAKAIHCLLEFDFSDLVAKMQNSS